MFASLGWTGRRRWTAAQTVSVVAHAALIAMLVYAHHHVNAILLQPNLVAHGQGGSGKLLYEPPRGAELLHTPGTVLITHATLNLPRPDAKPTQHFALQKGKENTATAVSPKAGSPHSIGVSGVLTGTEVMPALPTIFPDPPVARSEIPSGVSGDVIVEITIDENGNVIDTHLLRGLGYGIEDKVITTLYQWHFRPATRDGVAIPSKQDVHFHYPS